jgi:hypothetical protein
MSGLRWTQQDYADHLAKTGVAGSRNHADTSKPPFNQPAATAGLYALGRLKTGEMNKGEAAYNQHLWQRFFAKEILWHKFEAMKFRLADNTFYTPDFTVLTADGFIELHEYKGHWLEDARVKIKVAASLYPFRFIAVTPRAKKNGGGYDVEQF